MGGTFSNFHIAISGLLASQAAINMTGQNIANVNTEGYSRQAINFESNQRVLNNFSSNVVVPLMSGVEVQDIQRARNGFLDAQFRNQNSITGYAQVISDVSVSMNEILGEPADAGIAAKLNSLFEAASDLAANPEDTTAKNVFVNAGIALSDAVNQVDFGLESLRDTITKNNNGKIDFTVSELNDKLNRIAQLNALIAQSNVANNPENKLQDERDLLLDQVSGMIDATITQKSNSAYEVSIMASSQEAKVTGSTSFVSHDNPIVPAINTASGNNTLTLSVNNGNGTATGPFTVTFDDNSSIRDVVEKINLTFEAAGGQGNIASLNSANQLVIQTSLISDAKNSGTAEVDITGGTALASLGLAVTTSNGSDAQKVVLADETGMKAKFDYLQGTNEVGVNAATLAVVQNNSLASPIGTVSNFGGELGGYFDAVNKEIPELREALNNLSMNLKDSFNGLLTLGQTTSGAAGQELFTGNSAGDFAVNANAISNPDIISPGENGSISDGSIAAELAELFFGNSTSIGSKASEEKIYIKASDASAGVVSGMPIIPGEQINIRIEGIVDDNGSQVNAGTNGFAGGSLIQIEFVDASGAVLGGAIDFPPSAGAPDDAVFYSGNAPAGAAFVRLKTNATTFNDNDVSNNSGHFDITISKGGGNASEVTNNFTDAFANITGKFGARANLAISKSDNAQTLTGHIDANRLSESGVSLEEEAANLLQYQNSFQASARVMQVMDSIIEEILNMLL